MMDLHSKRSNPELQISEENEENIKKCIDCGTSKTPLWRGGPAGPKSLCNACGIRSRKRIRVISGNKQEKARVFSSTTKKITGNSNNSSSSTNSTITSISSSSTNSINNNKNNSNNNNNNNNKIKTLNQRLISLGREVMMQKSTVGKRSIRKKLGEEEQAAVLLMALSYGSVYA